MTSKTHALLQFRLVRLFQMTTLLGFALVVSNLNPRHSINCLFLVSAAVFVVGVIFRWKSWIVFAVGGAMGLVFNGLFIAIAQNLFGSQPPAFNDVLTLQRPRIERQIIQSDAIARFVVPVAWLCTSVIFTLIEALARKRTATT